MLAGAPGRDACSQEALAAFLSEATRLGASGDVRHVGSVDDLAPLYLAADALVSPSAHEGLSLAQLEALASGRPVVATAVGGAPEVAGVTRALSLVPKDAEPAAFCGGAPGGRARGAGVGPHHDRAAFLARAHG